MRCHACGWPGQRDGERCSVCTVVVVDVYAAERVQRNEDELQTLQAIRRRAEVK